jgi:glycerol-3-phosphate O-acyltransferase
MDTNVNKKVWPGLLMYVNRTFRNAFEGIHYNEKGFNNMKSLLDKKEKVVLVPIYRSFLDLTVILYSLYVN